MAFGDPTAGFVSPYFTIACETEGAVLRFTTDNSEPTETSEFVDGGGFQITSGTPTIIKVRAFKNGMTPSDIATKTYTPVTVPMALPDGSILFYDRGTTYGEYCIGDDGYPVRLSDGVDDGSSGSANWRYLICDQADLDNGAKNWGPTRVSEDLTSKTSVGYGLPNTEAMITKYADDDTYWWKFIADKRTSFGYLWFMPSKDELNMIYENKSVITGQGGDAFQTDYFYWSSSEDNILFTWGQDFSNGQQNNLTKGATSYCRLLRRI